MSETQLENNALSAAFAAKLAYEHREDVEAAVRARGMTKFTWLDSHGTQGFVASNDELCMISFRGTEVTSPTDWLVDIKLRKESRFYGNVRCRIHRGFIDAFAAISLPLTNALDKHEASKKLVMLAGHSLGAAVATIAAAELAHIGKVNVLSLFTFGSPRVGNAAFAKFLKKNVINITRFVNNNDVVARIPLFWYQHAGALCYFTCRKNMRLNPGWLFRLADRVAGWFLSRKGAFDVLQDHSMTGYYGLVERSAAMQVKIRQVFGGWN